MLSLAALLTAFHPTSDACGWDPPPTVHRVARHVHTFVVLGDAEPMYYAWETLSPYSYDGTQMAELTPLPTPRELTLVGPGGTHVISADHQVALDRAWDLGRRTRTALELPDDLRGSFAIALDGKLADAKWHAIEWTYTPSHPIANTDLAISFANGATIVRRGKLQLATLKGQILGAVDVAHRRYVVTDTGNGDVALTPIGFAA